MKKTALILAFAATTMALAGCGKKTDHAADAASDAASSATDEATDAAATAPSAAASDTKMAAPVKK